MNEALSEAVRRRHPALNMGLAQAAAPRIVSCVIQIDSGNAFVTDPPYALVLLDGIRRQIGPDRLRQTMETAGYREILRKKSPCPAESCSAAGS